LRRKSASPQTGFSSSVTGEVITRNTRSTSPEFEMACSTPGGRKIVLLALAPTVILELFKVFDQLRRHTSIVIVEHNLDLVLALADRVFALERGAVFHQGPAAPLLTDLEYRKKILWL
jgi:ABC-type lipopolysaccharide export system ATPase subunit